MNVTLTKTAPVLVHDDVMNTVNVELCTFHLTFDVQGPRIQLVHAAVKTGARCMEVDPFQASRLWPDASLFREVRNEMDSAIESGRIAHAYRSREESRGQADGLESLPPRGALRADRPTHDL